MAQPLVKGSNVQFLAVARLTDRTIVTWCSNGASVDLAGVRAVLDPQQMRNIEANKHYNFSSAGVAWHINSDGLTWIYLSITARVRAASDGVPPARSPARARPRSLARDVDGPFAFA